MFNTIIILYILLKQGRCINYMSEGTNILNMAINELVWKFPNDANLSTF